MPEVQNKFGLSRNIPEPIKRQIRQECGFGCVCCGLAIASYEHIEPEFHEAKEHDPNNMAFLCEGCHSRVTRGFWSKEKIRNARKEPWAIIEGRCHDAFDLDNHDLVVWLGGNKIVKVPTIFKVDEISLLSIERPEVAGGPYRISGDFYDDKGNLQFRIVRNEWFGEVSNWDIQCIGSRIFIRTKPRRISLEILCIPPNGIVVEKISMFYGNTQFIGDQYRLHIIAQDKSAVVISGREIVGEGENRIIFSAKSDGGVSIGPGPFVMRSLTEPIPSTAIQKVGRNDPCSCSSGHKYKKCCGN
jgi:hypothetical protein